MSLLATVTPRRLLLLHACVLLVFERGPHVSALLQREDWLVSRPVSQSKAVFSTQADGTMLLSNGLVSRRFSIRDGQWATISLSGEEPNFIEMLRGVSPEARINVSCPSFESSTARRKTLDYAAGSLEGKTDPNVTGSSIGSAGIAVGGLRGQQRYALLDLDRWNLTRGAEDFVYISHSVGIPSADWAWSPGARNSAMSDWPPKGVQLQIRFHAPQAHCGCYCKLEILVVYELYDGLPTFGKWVEVTNAGSTELLVETLVVEELHAGEHAKSRMHLETNYMPRKTDWSFAQIPAADPHQGQYKGSFMNYPTWWIDPDYEDDLHDQSLHAEVAHVSLLLQLQYPLGPFQTLHPDDSFASFKSWLSLYDSDDVERQSLSRRRVVRTLFPQVTEAPLYFYATQADSASIRTAADQCAEAGFEAIILSFGSGFNPSSTNESYIAQMAKDVEYVHSKGLIIGGYTLMQNPPGLSGDDYCKSPDGGATYNSHIADFTTEFHRMYRNAIVSFLAKTKMDMLETDGPYEGATCAPTNNSGFTHTNNSQVRQWNATVEFYRTLKAHYNTYLTVPDPYWMSGGTNKEPMGYTDAWNHIPSDKDGTLEYLTMGRMYLYDGTYHKPTTMGWMGFELSRTPPPMDAHLDVLELAAASYLGQGNVPCYRGQVLFDEDSAEVRRMWSLWTAHYKRYRSILMSDPVHVTRPGQNGGAIETSLHVNASAKAAFANFFWASHRTVTKPVRLPMYYANMPRGATVQLKWGGSLVNSSAWTVPTSTAATIEEDYTLRVNVTMAPQSFLWLSITCSQSRTADTNGV